MKNARFGFTLAEVLITIGIIGVVAAMTIPNLIEAYQKKATVQRLKQTYSILTQATRLFTTDTGESAENFNTQLDGKTFLQTYVNPSLKIIGECNSITECYNGDKPLAIDRKTKINSPNYIAQLINGTYIGARSDAGGILFFIDINGSSKPNISSRDIFYFFLVNKDSFGVYPGCEGDMAKIKDGLYPGGYGSCYVPFTTLTREQLLATSPVHRACNKAVINPGHGGDACAAVIMMDGWTIAKDYPWK